MAAACPSLILESVMNKLGSSIFHKIKLNCPLRIQLGDLRSKLKLIGDVVDDAEGMAVLFPNFVRKWVCDLQRVLFELDDILDEALTRSMPSSGSILEKVRLCLDNVPFDITIAHHMKKINNRLAGIIEECCKCNMIVKPTTSNQDEKPITRKGILRYDPDYVRDDEFCMIGRDDDKRKVIQMLFNEHHKGGVVWITGHPGMGKSTLCRAIYNDEKIINHFELRLWVNLGSLSDFRSVEFWKKIVVTLLEADEGWASKLEAEEDTDVQWKNKLTNLIGQRKTLLVLENSPPHSYIRGYTPSLLLDLQDVIATSNKGSKILLPQYFKPRSTFYHHEVRYDLSEHHCWSIFANIAFLPGHDREEQSPPKWMVDLGKQIVSKCNSRLALLKGVGTLLYGKEDRSTWEYFACDYDFHDSFLNYRDYCKLCRFLPKCQYNVGYLSLFLEVPEFKYETMIQQFAAQGFTSLSNNMQQSLAREFFAKVEVEDKWDTKGKYKISDAGLFCNSDILQLAGEENIVLKWAEPYLPKEARHVSFARPSSSSRGQSHQDRILPDCLVEDVIHKRTLLFLGELFPIRMSVQTLNTLATNLRHLRVLDLHDMALQMLPTSIGNLIHLRYLDLSRNDFRVLPRMIYGLKNLLTLKLNYCDKLIKLSQRIKKLSHLKHLEINMCFDLTQMPSSIARLTSLEALDRFIVSPHNGGLSYLQHLNNLNGHLSIELPRHWEKSKSDAEQADLERKIGLTVLEFKWQGADNGVEENDDDGVLEKLKPCTRIENLSILNFGGKTFPSWIASLGIENHLTEITLSRCKRCQILPPFHQMPSLRSLTLTSMNIEYLQDGSILWNAHRRVVSMDANMFFPSLRELKIGRMPKLKGWWNLGSIELSAVVDDLPRFPCLDRTEIWNCPYLTLIPLVSCSWHDLLLQDVSMMVLRSVNGRNTYSVEIISFQDMTSLPNQFLTKLPECLKIKGCNSLQTLRVDGVEGIKAFANVKKLSIADCPALKHLSSILRHLVNLASLTVSRCSEELDCLYKDEENRMPWKALQKLWALTIEGFGNLVALPKGLRQLPGIFSLKIIDCKALKWEFGSLPRSEFLTVKSCPHFSTRIEELKMEHKNVEVLE